MTQIANGSVKFFDDIADDYHDTMMGEKERHISRMKHSVHKSRLAMIDRSLPKQSGLNIFDFGCGSGEYLCSLIKKGHQGIGMDPAENLIRLAKEHAQKEGLAPDLFAVGGLNEWPKGKFDVILAVSVLVFTSVEEEKDFFAKCRASLNPNGVVICNFYNRFVDLVTYNSYTLKFLGENILQGDLAQLPAERREQIQANLATMLPASKTNENWKAGSFKDKIRFRTRNPFRLEKEIAAHGFDVDKFYFSRFHMLPPEVVERPENFDLYEKFVYKFEDAEQSELGPAFATNMTLTMRPAA